MYNDFINNKILLFYLFLFPDIWCIMHIVRVFASLFLCEFQKRQPARPMIKLAGLVKNYDHGLFSVKLMRK